MITMMDEIFDRGYQAGRAELHDGIDRLIRKVRNAIVPSLAALHHVEWDSPWKGKPPTKA